jgi:phytoene dehydrogenase-like protein
MAQRFDAIIIGGGHNGLVTAAYLGRAGRKTLVLERREMVGGCAVTEEIWPGFRVSTAAYLTSLLQERIIQDLELPRYGYRVDAKDPAFFSPFPDGRCFFMWQDGKRTLEEIARVFPARCRGLSGVRGPTRAPGAGGRRLLLTTPPQFPPRGVGDLIEHLKTRRPVAQTCAG